MISERFSYYVVPQQTASVMFEPKCRQLATEYFTQIITARLDYYLRKSSILSSNNEESKPAAQVEADQKDYHRMVELSGGNRNLFKRPLRSVEKMSFPSEKRIAKELALWYKSVFGCKSRLKSPSAQDYTLDIRKDNTGSLQKKLSRERRVEEARLRERERRKIMKDHSASAQEKDACRVDPVFRSTFEDLYQSVDRVSPKKTPAVSVAGSALKSGLRFDFNSASNTKVLLSTLTHTEERAPRSPPAVPDISKILRIFNAKETRHQKSASSKTLLTAFGPGSEQLAGSNQASRVPLEQASTSRSKRDSRPTHVRIVSAQLERIQSKKQDSTSSFRLLFDPGRAECKVIKNTGASSRQEPDLKSDTLDRIRSRIMLKAKYRLQTSRVSREQPVSLFGTATPLSGDPRLELKSPIANKTGTPNILGLQNSAKQNKRRIRAEHS